MSYSILEYKTPTKNDAQFKATETWISGLKTVDELAQFINTNIDLSKIRLYIMNENTQECVSAISFMTVYNWMR